MMVEMDFYCKDCRLDQKQKTFKRQNRFGFWYETSCVTCEKTLKRLPQSKLDPYFFESIKLKRERDVLAKDLIQPGDPRFKLYYKDQWDKMEAGAEALQNKENQESDDKHDFLKNSRSKSEGVKVLDALDNFDRKLNENG